MATAFRPYRWSTWALVISLVPTVAAAQIVSDSLAGLEGKLKVGQIVVVTEETGRQITGKVAEVSASSLVLLRKERKVDARGAEHEAWSARETLLEPTVRRIVHRDSLLNGTLSGLAAGVATFWIALQTDSCAPFPYDLCFNSHGIFPLLVYPTAGAIAGALIDAAFRKPLYIRPSVRSSRSVSVSPWVSTERTGISLSMRF